MMDSGFGFFLTDDAFNKICALRSKREIPVALRMSVVGGGCSGFQYVFLMEEVGRNKKEGEGLMSDKELEENFENEDDLDDEDGFGDEDDFDEDFDEVGDFEEDFDENFDDDEVELHDADGNMFFVTDKASVSFLKGATVDYTQNLIGSGFSVRNPNATARCGCGNSFSV